ncbi:MAG: transcription antitermination protein NusB [Paramuribaculum sp.]|nr:transcription antitermination protein NusB [Paramuribaculum sp.]
MSGFRVQKDFDASLLSLMGDNKYLNSNKIIRALAGDDRLRAVIAKGSQSLSNFDECTKEIFDKIVNSSIYRSYIRQKDKDIIDDLKFWTVVIATVLAKDELFIACARKNADFTLSGFERGIQMAIDTLSSYSDTKSTLNEARNSLDRSLDKARELYFALLLLPVELTRLQEQKLDAAKHKYLPSAEALNPDTRFVDNIFPKLINESPEVKDFLKDNPIGWENDFTFTKKLLDKILASDIYEDYMNKPVTDRTIDCDFWRAVYKSIILPSDELAEVLESKSVFWNDDIEIMGTFVLKTVKRIANSQKEPVELLPKFKDDEDARFGSELFMYSVNNLEEYRSYIDKFINASQWDPERLAFMDGVIMITAIAELLNFPAIPIAVTLNEYIEIANSYSTQRSGQFINGILYSVINYLRQEGKLSK